MGVEIERRFRVRGRPWEGHAGEEIVQAYVASEEGRTVRVRVRGGAGWLTIKGPTRGLSRPEFELPVPAEWVRDLSEALALPGRIHKTRHEVPVGDHTWEVDVFHGDNDGLVVAELELSSEDEPFERPPWLGEEVSHDPRFTNAWLARHPWRTWGNER